MTPQRLLINIDGYYGETIDLPRVVRGMDEAAADTNWQRDSMGGFLAYRRPVQNARNNVYLSAGIHGDEPAGPMAVLQMLQEDIWPADAALWLCPCLNPAGISLNKRENANGVDLNRDYRSLQTEEVRTHIAWLQQQPRFNIHLCLHEDWEAQGFYVYEVNPDQQPSIAEKIVEAASKVCPIENAKKIDSWEAQGGIIRPKVNPAERPLWPEALYLIMNKTRLGYTLEAPSDYPLPVRVAALVAGTRAALNSL